MTILILGASGMLGHTLLYEFVQRGLEVRGTVRSKSALDGIMPSFCLERLIEGVDAYNFSSIQAAFAQTRPDVVINAIGLVRQLPEGRIPLPCIEINARLPQLLAVECARIGARFIHYSTDCVFSGHKGSPYTEDDPPSAEDVYGLSKFLGEVHAPALTLRTSIIGLELRNKCSLVEWFLAQEEPVKGYTQALYSGLTAVEQARVLAEYVLPNPALHGLFHLASTPISKYELLHIVGRYFGKSISITPDSSVTENKSLNATHFTRATGYTAPLWDTLIHRMHENAVRYQRDCHAR